MLKSGAQTIYNYSEIFVLLLPLPTQKGEVDFL